MIVITMKFSHYLQSRTLRREQSTIYSANIILILWWIMDISFLSEFKFNFIFFILKKEKPAHYPNLQKYK